MTLFSLLILWISSSTVFQIPYFYEKTAISCTVVLQIQRIIFLLLLRDFVFALVFCSFYYHGSRRGSLHIYSTQWSSSFLDYTLFFHQTQQFMVIIFPKKKSPLSLSPLLLDYRYKQVDRLDIVLQVFESLFIVLQSYFLFVLQIG